MRRFWCALALAIAPAHALAQYAGPGVETCRRHGENELRKENAKIKSLVFDADQNLQIDRYTRKVGSQFVASLLYGNGSIVYQAGVAIEISFLCLLADEKRAVFFHWTPRRDAPVLQQCRRGGGTAECLDSLLQVAERELSDVYSKHFIDARSAKEGSDAAVAAFRRSADAWKAYRDAECERRPAGDERKACMVELTRRRALDLR